MVKENLKRKKKHDRDKYYHLAKEQGYRSRAAFKLIQINRKYDFLSQGKVCIDLCAAPGGWCQVATKHMPADSIILGVDLLPIRPIPKVKTLVQDITTAECRAIVKREMRGHNADIVLCDGAPNVGAAYDKDAFVQNEIALAALRVATHHLGPGGTFLTKVYRSSDYNALMWVFNQLFGSVQAIKPSSSRQQSAEIFVLCLKYRAPHSIDPKMLDPQFVFQEMDDSGKGTINIFSAQYDKQKRHRGGYDDSGVLLHKKCTVSSFIDSDDPVQMLTDNNQIAFEPGCKPFSEHRLTTEEIKTCLADLKVLGKGDFKSLLKWRLKMREYHDSLVEAGQKTKKADDGSKKKEEKVEEKPLTAEEEEDEIQAEIRKLQDAKAAKTKREKKRDRERLAKLRLRQAYGMHHDAFDLPEHESIFTLKTIGDTNDLEAIRRGDFAEVAEGYDDSDMGGGPEEAEGEEENGSDSEEARAARLEAELEDSYQQYLSNKSDERLKGTRAGKRKKATMAALAAEKTSEDMAMYDGDMGGYIKLLTGKRKEDDEDTDTESEEEEGEGMEMSGEEEGQGTDGEVEDEEEDGDKKAGKHPLLIDAGVFAGVEKGGAKVSRWFSNPLFKSLGASLEADVDDEHEEDEDEIDNSKTSKKGGQAIAAKGKKVPQSESDDVNDESDEEEEQVAAPSTKPSAGKGKTTSTSRKSVVDEVLASLPKTDKQLRHEKRVKAMGRRERKAIERQRVADPEGVEENGELELVGAENTTANPEDAERAKKRRAMIKAGMGSALDEQPGSEGFEVVPADAPISLPIKDDRKYDSENEQWDDEERARTLAIATMMLRRSKAKELVDASYNRFAWNDAADLPEWFVDDEEKHFRPQIPIPKPLMDEMKERFKTLAAKPIAKVAEARARKKNRAVQRLKQAKAKASAIVSNPDMTERDKMKAIQKAVKGKGEFSRPDKVYAVVRKGGSSTASNKKGGAGGRTRVKLVDKRMKKDARGMKNAAKKGGKRGGGGKKRGKRAR